MSRANKFLARGCPGWWRCTRIPPADRMNGAKVTGSALGRRQFGGHSPCAAAGGSTEEPDNQGVLVLAGEHVYDGDTVCCAS